LWICFHGIKVPPAILAGSWSFSADFHGRKIVNLFDGE
jgi:hypothetical protein